MTDYALTHLGPHRFEELSQALALSKLGPSVKIFGDGPDGGREASFEGLRHFPTPDAPWNGYGVLQAKFRSRPESTAKNAQWLIRHMTAELEAWADPDSNRVRKGRVPEYLLIVSNVVLSSNPGSGGIDRVEAELWARARELALPLKGLEVWHHDKICRLLDGSRDIRHANADAVLAGDVLARLYEFVEQLETTPSSSANHSASGLPREVRSLIGREAEITRGLSLLEDPSGEDRAALVVTGPPGIGKTTVALRLSHLVAKSYPDGQFHIKLALSTGAGAPADLVLALLQALCSTMRRLPEERAQQLALLRASLSHRRVLLFIDDVVSEEALLDVLRMDGPFALVCTSRAKLSGLTGLLGFVELEPLPAQHSEELVRAVAGLDRLTDVQVSALAEGCAGHPLALHIAAAHLASRPKVSVARFLDDIASPDRGVRALKAGQTSLQPVLESSFDALTPDQSGLFTALGTLPHMSLTTDVVAAATATSLDELDDDHVGFAMDLLDSLFELSLIEQIDEDRYLLHEILHRFARLKSAATPRERRQTIIRHTCLTLAVRAQSATESIGFMDEEATVPAQSNADALHTLNEDRPGAVAMTEMARQHEVWEPLVLLASELTAFLWHGSHWRDLDRVYQCVLEAGTHAGNPGWTATAQHNLATAASHLGDSQRAIDLLQHSAQTAHEAGDPHQMFLAQLALGTLLTNLGRARDSIPLSSHGLPFWRIVDDRQALATALGNLGQAYMAVGQLRRAEQYLRNSKNLSQEGSPADLSNRGAIAALLRRTNRMAEAAQEACRDIGRARAVGSREWEAKALMELAETPVEEHPKSAPVQPLEAALAIYRDTGDLQGQVRVLFRLGDRAANQKDIQQAAEHLGECASLAYQIGDYKHAARSLVFLASYYGRIGKLDEAETCFADALGMARQLGNPGVLAEALQKRAEYVWHLGQVEQAVSLLTEAARMLESTEEQGALAQIKAALGEAFIVSGRWQEGAETLESVVSVMSSHASPATKSRAFRALAVLYSRRGLHSEAMSTITKALDQCERVGDTSGVLHCRMTLGNVHARNGEWSEALDQYDKAADLAGEQQDFHVALAARSQAAVCRLSRGDNEAAGSMTKLIPLAQRLGMKAVEAALHSNLGTHCAESGDYQGAVSQFRTALVLSEHLEDTPLQAAVLFNLARICHKLGDAELSRTYARQSFALDHALGNWSKAGAALLHLGLLHHETAPDADSPTFHDLLGEDYRVDRRVIEALRTRILQSAQASDAKPAPTTASPQPIASMRRINVSQPVLQALEGVDLESLVIRLGNSRQHCEACNLLIDEAGEANLLLLRHAQVDHVLLRLAHPHCVSSKVIQLTGAAPKQPQETVEVECVLFGRDTAGITADWYGGWGTLNGAQGVEDLALKMLLEVGFVDLQYMLQIEDRQVLDFRDAPRIDGGDVEARLVGNKLSITCAYGQLLPPMAINFYPHWYQNALGGSLVVVAGRNLQGMTSDDPSYLHRAMALGQVVGATLPLTVVRPSRNSPCPCTMRTGRKFKDCCGRSSAPA
ncbi:tetratricopeptide repeat protein [Streptomyces sp. NPDC058642]|uniref:tetratricopeptide repeat protein n=1 Tax=Streptomyces sp. NPDC058642 TaxID=3346572 RepID=UPI00365D1904